MVKVFPRRTLSTRTSKFECEVIDVERLKHNGLVTFGGVDRPRSAIAIYAVVIWLCSAFGAL